MSLSKSSLLLAPARVQALRAALLTRRAAACDALRAAADARRVLPQLRRLAQAADEALRALYALARLDAAGCALLAVGGYGRGALFPYSDVDVLLLLPENADENALRPHIEAFISACWDVGLEIGASVRSAEQCLRAADEDLTLQTALLEARLVAGNEALAAQIFQRFRAGLDALAFFNAKIIEQRQRHAKYEDSPYALEPNCKESPGGLRDIHMIFWAAHAAGLAAPGALRAAQLATALELRQLRTNEALLSLLRARLHILAGRREDRLIFDMQSAAAESFGIAHRRAPDGHIVLRASERLMRRYYLAAKAVTQLAQILLQNIEGYIRRARAAHGHRQPAARPINVHFGDLEGRLDIADDTLYQRAPHAILETFLVHAQTPGLTGLSARTLRALYHARRLMSHDFRADAQNRRTFLAILQQPRGVLHAFRLMNQSSVLGRYVWAFRHSVGQMQHDLFHVYTVDQHALMVLRQMRRFFMAEHAHEYPFCAQLAAGWEKPWLLYAAALFHDIGKGRGGNHAEVGAREVRRFFAPFTHCGAAPQDVQFIEFLVAQHLLLSSTAQKQDLSEPAVIEKLAAIVGDERHLTALYLLTAADMQGTGPKVWTPWKEKLLQELYRRCVQALGGSAPHPAALIEERKRHALHQMRQAGVPPGAHCALWAALDVRYFRRHDAGEIAWHARALWKYVGEKTPGAPAPCIVRARVSPHTEGLQVLAYTADAPDLFARMCGFFDRAGFAIVDARIHTTLDGYALDTFQIISDSGARHSRDYVHALQEELPRAILETSRAPLPAPRLGRPSPRARSFPIPPYVDLRPDAAAERWILSITTSDRAGLLYGIARVLAAHSIEVELAKISTTGERVQDSFLLRGGALKSETEQLAVQRELVQVLGG